MPTMFPILTGEMQKPGGDVKLGTTEFGHVSVSITILLPSNFGGTQFDTCHNHTECFSSAAWSPVPAGLSLEWLLDFYFEHHLVRLLLSDDFACCMLRMGSTDKVETPLSSHYYPSVPCLQ